MPVFSSNTTTPTIGVENFLASVNVAGKRFTLAIDLSGMLANDVLEIRVYKMILTGGTQRVISGYPITFMGAQPTDNMIFITDQVDNYLTDANSLRFSINQTFGTARAFPWTVEYELPDPTNFGLLSIDSNGRLDIIKMAGQTLTVAAGVTVPASIASPTNITAGTITTVTNLTNAPTNGDLTNTMKASVNAEVDTALADYDAPTHTELTSELTSLGSAILSAISALNNISANDVWAAATRTLTAISDSSGVTTLLSRIASVLNISSGKVESNIKQINDTNITGDGSGTPWGPA